MIDFASLGEKLLGDALVATERSALEGLVSPVLAQLQGPDRQAIETLTSILVHRLAVTNSALRALSQELVSARRSRETRLRIDPLPFIPQDRFEQPPAPPTVWECNVGDAGFVGSNWHRLEIDREKNYRWAGPALASSVLLPSLGGGRIKVAIEFRIPFRGPYAQDSFVAFLDGFAIPLTKRPDANVCEGIVDIPEDLLASRTALIIVSKPHSDPRTDGQRDPRILGIGLTSVRLERVFGADTGNLAAEPAFR